MLMVVVCSCAHAHVLMCSAVSAGPEVFMEGEEDIRANLNEGLLFSGKPQLSLSLARAVADCSIENGSGFLMLDVMILFQLSKGVSSPKQKEVQPSGPECWKSQSQ